ncbi:MAG: polysaccharide pyruvyl transferase family protein [Bacilli bacterium]|nr:polysaccharide pyruvyl transferase family protein [Bacilli bacterium]
MKKRKTIRIGIYGWWCHENYGGVLTYYALNQILTSEGYDVYMIPEAYGIEPRYKLRPTSTSMKFASSYYKTIPQPLYKDLHLLNDMFDVFFVGGDQLWNNLISFVKNDYYLSFVHDDKLKLSFATSFGNKKHNPSAEFLKEKGDLLKRFNAVSVREDYAEEIAKIKYGVDSTSILDAVFLLKKSQYVELAKKSNINLPNKFLFAFILNPSIEKRQQIEFIAKKLNLEIILCSDLAIAYHDEFKKVFSGMNAFTNFSIEDFLKCYEKCSYIVTDSFHGTCFAYIFRKPFSFYFNKERGSDRFKYLMNSVLLLEERSLDQKTSVEMLHDNPNISLEIDFSKSDFNVSNLINKTNNWLNKVYKLINKTTKKRKNGFSINNLINKIHLKQKIIHVNDCKHLDYNKFKIDAEADSATSLKRIENTNPKSNIVGVLNVIDECVGCSSCENSCPASAIKLIENKDGFLNPSVDLNKCVHCNKCVKNCSVLNHKFDNAVQPKCYAGIAENKIREESSSGGLFSVLANYVIKNNGYVCGAVFTEEYKVCHILSNNINDIAKMRGSKYYQSNLGGVFKNIREKLKDGKVVLFSGMPCQVAGLYSFLGERYDNLYTIDILCHGISSFKVFRKYANDVLKNKKIVDLKFKAKKPWGWHAGINASFDDGTSYRAAHEHDLFYMSYLNNLSKNKPCGTCSFDRLPRQGDITLSDFWGIEKFDPKLNDDMGTSCILLNNHHGETLYKKIENELNVSVQVPLEYAVFGNRAVTKPFPSNKNRNIFFSRLDSENFVINTKRCLSDLNIENNEFAPIINLISSNIKNRSLVAIGRNSEFEKQLAMFSHLKIDYYISDNQLDFNEKCGPFSYLKNKKHLCYVVYIVSQSGFAKAKEILNLCGYKENDDYISFVKEPIVITNFDLSKNKYNDTFGNRIIGFDGIIKKVVFRGYNNHLTIGRNVNLKGVDYFIFSNNSSLTIDDNTVFKRDTKFELNGGLVDGYNTLHIGSKCIFEKALFRMYNNINKSAINIGNNCIFGQDIYFHANTGKRIVIGNNCMFSRFISIFSGDGHSLFDLQSGKRTNNYCADDTLLNYVIIGSHTWVGVKSIILSKSYIGDGSTIGAGSVVKGKFTNNCIVAGNPAKIVKLNTAWCDNNNISELKYCGNYIYPSRNEQKLPLIGKKVLVIGGTGQNGVALVDKLLSYGNDVTIATRGNKKDNFGNRIERIVLDVSNLDSTKAGLSGKKYDVVFHNLAYSSNYLKNILDYVHCDKVVELSSIAVYKDKQNIDVKEDDFNPFSEKFDWNSSPASYGAGKRDAECALFQNYKNIPSVAVRIPYVVPTERLDYYCDCIVNNKPMSIRNLDACLCFIKTTEIADFLVWVANQELYGPVNFSSEGYVKIIDIIRYIEKKTLKKAFFNTSGAPSPFLQEIYLNLDKAKKAGYYPLKLSDWFWNTLDSHIIKALKNKS